MSERAGDVCEYCKAPRKFSPSPFDVEHTCPTSLGGDSTLNNLAFSCNGCNGLKSNKVEAVDPINNQTVPLFNPRIHQWDDHFIWSESGLYIIGITPTGRATVELLKLNRQALVNLRSLLSLVG